MTTQWSEVNVSEGTDSSTPCDCCNRKTRKIGGELDAKDDWLCFYDVRWSEGRA